jgi:hypothetical protein
MSGGGSGIHGLEFLSDSEILSFDWSAPLSNGLFSDTIEEDDLEHRLKTIEKNIDTLYEERSLILTKLRREKRIAKKKSDSPPRKKIILNMSKRNPINVDPN